MGVGDGELVPRDGDRFGCAPGRGFAGGRVEPSALAGRADQFGAVAVGVCAAQGADIFCRQVSFAYARRRRSAVRYETVGTPASSSTRSESSLLTGSMIRAATRWKNTSSPAAALSSPSTRYACASAAGRCPIRDDVIGSGPQAQVQLALPRRQLLPRRGLQHLYLSIIMSRAEMLDIARPAVRGVHDRHRRRTRRRLHGADIRRHRASLRPLASAQLQPSSTVNQQVSAPRS